VGDLGRTAAAAAGVFAGTDIDDLIVLTVLFLSARASGRPRAWAIWAGQYAGIAVLVAVSVVAALGLTIVPDRWVGLLGLVPLVLGVRGLLSAVRSRRADGVPPAVMATGFLSVMGVTIANGGDNVTVYTPLFRSTGLGGALITVAVFAAGVALWCVSASWLGTHPLVLRAMERFGHWIVPGVFTVIGGFILIGSGVLPRLLGR
jgi:cadmium resistance protein CadD (predicted permease)